MAHKDEEGDVAQPGERGVRVPPSPQGFEGVLLSESVDSVSKSLSKQEDGHIDNRIQYVG